MRVAAKRLGLWIVLGACGLARAAEPAEALSAEQIEFFESKIRPILAESCYKCHSVESGKSKGGLLLDSRDALRKGGEGGAVIEPGDPEKSVLIDAVRYRNEDLQMPPEDQGGKLSPEKIAALEEWVRMGAPDPRAATEKARAMDMAAARKHWAFQPVSKPAVPAVKNARWVRTPVDAFILAKLEANGLAPSPAVDNYTLLRRATYDLTGLPPTAGEMETFLADKKPDAYARAVDRLLASPRYGERWGRFWLDVARYADTKGYLAGNVERRYTFSHTYRDYVIRAFNEDKPYDRFLTEQLAADQLPLDEDKSALAAMGFLTLGRRFLNNQNDIIDDRIDVVSRGLMGLTVSCARCHDHKFDPIPTADYYSLHGVFASSKEPDEYPLLGPLVDSPAYQDFLRKRADIEAKVKDRERTEVEKFLAGIRTKTGDYFLAAHDAVNLPKGEKLDVFAGARKINVESLRRWQTLLAEEAKAPGPVLAPWFAFASLPAAEIASTAPQALERLQPTANARVIAELTKDGAKLTSLKDVAEAYNRVFADVDRAWQEAVDAAKKANQPPPESLEKPELEAIRQLLYADDAPPNLGYDRVVGLIRRTINDKSAPLKREIEALNWTEPGAPLRGMALVDRNPKNSRIFVRGNPANLGPEVPRHFLEVLAPGERTAATTTSGRLELARDIASPANPLTARVFVNRVWGWHFGQALVRTPSDFGVRTAAPVQRELLDWLAATFVEGGWSVKQLHRAIVLSSTYRQASDPVAAAATIDPDNQLVHRFNRRRLEFEALRDTLLAVSGSLDLKAGGIPDDLMKEPFAKRRTVYGFIDRQNLPGMFRTFDYPNPDTTSAQRFATTVPQQALFMMNSPFVVEQARQLAARPEVSAAASDTGKIEALYRVLYQRRPDNEELALAQGFLRQVAAMPRDAQPVPRAGWHYGHGVFDAAAGRVRDFQAMSVRKDTRVSPAEAYPDPKFGHLSLTALGGHPGQSPERAGIRRWVAPADGWVKIEATLGHANASGDGVHGRIVSSARGGLGEWTVRNDKAATNLEGIAVKAGDTIDFLVDCIGTANADTYSWAPKITFTDGAGMGGRTWDARKDFGNLPKPIVPLAPWEELAQVLLLSNELAFID